MKNQNGQILQTESTKRKVLDAMQRADGAFFSGQELAQTLGISRTAVWKAVRGLQEDGCRIESVSGRGYRLIGSEDRLSEATLRAALGADGDGLLLEVFDEIDSTNNEAKRLAVAGSPTSALIVAGSQSAGRGRMGRNFYSPAQTGVYFSVLYASSAPLQDAVAVTGATSVAVMRAIRDLCGKQASIKWVNDLYLEGRKVCGILTEAITGMETGETRQIIVGIGINLRRADFPPELQETAGSVCSETVARATLIAGVYHRLIPFLQAPQDFSWLADYRKYSCVIGNPITWTRGEAHFTGVAEGIDDRGALLVRNPDGTLETLRTGEISVRVQSGT
jgi:BirA family biotin operon repressor/biotin-[acetyl-CoA-carboxylase] ligase